MRKGPIIVLLSCQAVILATVLLSNAHARKLQAKAPAAPVSSATYAPAPEHCPLEPPEEDLMGAKSGKR